MDVSKVVDHKSEGERLLVIHGAEGILDLRDVSGAVSAGVSLKECDKCIQSSGYVNIALVEVREVFLWATLVKVWQIDEMPAALPRVAITLDVVCEGSAFGEWVVSLFQELWVVLCEWSKHGKSCIKRIRGLLF